jgi:hypothetical protein
MLPKQVTIKISQGERNQQQIEMDHRATILSSERPIFFSVLPQKESKLLGIRTQTGSSP